MAVTPAAPLGWRPGEESTVFIGETAFPVKVEVKQSERKTRRNVSYLLRPLNLFSVPNISLSLFLASMIAFLFLQVTYRTLIPGF